MSSEIEPTSESEGTSIPPRTPIFTDETIEESRLSKLIEESTRRGFEAGRRQQKDIPETSVTAPIPVEVTSNLPLYRSNFGFMHLLSSSTFKGVFALFVIVFGGMGLLWVFSLLYSLTMGLFGTVTSINLVGFALPYLWIPVVIFALSAMRLYLVERHTKLYTTSSGHLIYEKPTIAPLLIFGSTHRILINQIGSVDDEPERIFFIVLKSKRVAVDTPSEESKYFKKMRGVKQYESLRKALGQ